MCCRPNVSVRNAEKGKISFCDSLSSPDFTFGSSRVVDRFLLPTLTLLFLPKRLFDVENKFVNRDFDIFRYSLSLNHKYELLDFNF